METKKIKFTKAVLLFLLLTAFQTGLKSQTCHTIDNQLPCTADGTYVLFSGGISCGAPIPFLIGGNSTLLIPCSAFCGAGPYTIEVTITDYASIPVTTPQTVNSSTSAPSFWGPCAGGVPAACCNIAYFYNITWSSSVTTIY